MSLSVGHMSRKKTNPMEDKITISLSKKQRDLLLKYEPYFSDHELFKLISIAVTKGKDYEIYLDEEQIGNLLDQITDFQNQEENEKMHEQLEDLWEYLEPCFDLFPEEEDDDTDYSEHSDDTGSVYVLKVSLAHSKEIWRNIAIREGQTLHNLHNIIFEAFDRYDEHMYSFLFPHSPQKKYLNVRKIYQSSDEYTHPYACEDQGPFASEGQNASKATIESLNLDEGQVFYYLFDFGDEWWHEITVEKMDETADDGDYPRVVERKGESPEQYDYPDDEDYE